MKSLWSLVLSEFSSLRLAGQDFDILSVLLHQRFNTNSVQGLEHSGRNTKSYIAILISNVYLLCNKVDLELSSGLSMRMGNGISGASLFTGYLTSSGHKREFFDCPEGQAKATQ